MPKDTVKKNKQTLAEDKKAVKKSKKQVKDDGDEEEEIELEPVKKTRGRKKNVDTTSKDEPKTNEKKSKESKSVDNNKILEVKTTQTTAIKHAIERISNVISECSIVFIPPDDSENNNYYNDDEDYYEEIESNNETSTKKKGKDKKKQKSSTGGIRIIRITEDKSILIKLSLDAIKFETFKCLESKITIGLDMQNFHTKLKCINDDDSIMFYMNKDNKSSLFVRGINGDNDNSEETDLEICLLETTNPEMPLRQENFQNKITILSEKFHSICKQLNNSSATVEITSVNNEIHFCGEDEGGKVRKTYRDKENQKAVAKGEVIEGIFELRHLMCFSKCNKLCQTVDLYLKNDFPLVIAMGVGTLGKMYIFLSPLENPGK